MARTPHITAEMLLEAGAAITLEKGADALNVRSVAAKLNCSVQPVFRNFGSMETFRRAVIEYLDGTYQSFIAQYLDKSDYLFTISLAHILLARDRRNLFGVLFLSNEYGSCCAAPSANSAQNNAVFSFKEFGEKTWSSTHKTKKNIWKT